jgi:hypothetical protein
VAPQVGRAVQLFRSKYSETIWSNDFCVLFRILSVDIPVRLDSSSALVSLYGVL